MKQSKGKSYKSHSRNHTTKTPAEKKAYNEKVRLTTSEGETNKTDPSKSSTLNAHSVYGNIQTAGTPDRNPIKPPIDRGWTIEKIIGLIVSIFVFIGLLVGFVVWITTLKNRVDFNEKEISQLNKTFEDDGVKREDLNTRITRLEQWKDLFADELKQIKQDLKNGVSTEQIDLKLMELEKRIIDQVKKNDSVLEKK